MLSNTPTATIRPCLSAERYISVYKIPRFENRERFYYLWRCFCEACLVSGPISEPVQVLQALFELRSVTDCAGLIFESIREGCRSRHLGQWSFEYASPKTSAILKATMSTARSEQRFSHTSRDRFKDRDNWNNNLLV